MRFCCRYKTLQIKHSLHGAADAHAAPRVLEGEAAARRGWWGAGPAVAARAGACEAWVWGAEEVLGYSEGDGELFGTMSSGQSSHADTYMIAIPNARSFRHVHIRLSRPLVWQVMDVERRLVETLGSNAPRQALWFEHGDIKKDVQREPFTLMLEAS